MNTLVFITQDGPFDYSPAQEYGDIVFLTDREITPLSNQPTNKRIVEDIVRIVGESYIPGRDWILPAGSPIAIAHALRAMFKKVGPHQFLKWDAQRRRYLEYTIE